MQTNNYKSHIFSTVALFVMGNAIITLPFCGQENGFTIFLLTAVFTISFVLLAVPILNFSFSYCGGKSFKPSVFKKIILCIASLAVIVSAVYGGVSAFSDYISFLRDIQLPRTNSVFISAVMLALIVALVLCSSSAFLKLCLFIGVITFGTVLLLFAVSIKMFYIPSLNFDFKLNGGEWVTAIKYFSMYFLPASVPVAFIVITKQKAGALNAVTATAAGLLAVTFSLLQSIFVLGGAAAQYDYPYLFAISAFSSGSLFTRLDGLVYFVFFAVSTVKASLCAKTVWLVIKHTIGSFK